MINTPFQQLGHSLPSLCGGHIQHGHLPQEAGVNVCGQVIALVDCTHGEALPGVLLANPALRGLAQTFQRGHAPTVQHNGFPADGAGLCFPLVDVLNLKGVQVDTLFNLYIVKPLSFQSRTVTNHSQRKRADAGRTGRKSRDCCKQHSAI